MTGRPYAHLRVVELSVGIAGGYCAKLFADAGADVVKVEPPGGDPLRSWKPQGAAGDGALFRYLAHGKRSVTGQPSDAAVRELVADADVVIDHSDIARQYGPGLCAEVPGVVVVSITPYGRTGPYAGRPATEFTLQAESGSILDRGVADEAPYQAGGRVTEWFSGVFAAAAAAAAVRGASRSGHGDHLDVSMAEAMHIAASNYSNVRRDARGRPPLAVPHRWSDSPSIEPTADGYVGVCANTPQLFTALLNAVERPDLVDDPDLNNGPMRRVRPARCSAVLRAWTTARPTAEAVARIAAAGVPAVPVHSGATVTDDEHLSARGVFVGDPTGTFRLPRRPWLLDGDGGPSPRPAPAAGEHTGRVEPHTPARPAATTARGLPLAGVRVLDFTSWWAGPSASWLLAAFGAEVIHVESPDHIDGWRLMGTDPARGGDWWDRSGTFTSVNVNKRDVGLRLRHPRGRELFYALVGVCDVVMENSVPRVVDKLDIGWDVVARHNPRAVMVRMPAYGLDGPWRDRAAFAQTIEQLTGMAWVTGHADDQPRAVTGPCDPNAGIHAAFATLAALAARDVTGRGSLVEVPMVETALAITAEQVVTFTAYGEVLQRAGNRDRAAAPQGLYRCLDEGDWLAVSVATDGQWAAFERVAGGDWPVGDPDFATGASRAAHHDRLDRLLARWCEGRSAAQLASLLTTAGVPAAVAADPCLVGEHPQFAARGFCESVDHPRLGAQCIPGLPLRSLASPRWVRTPAPLLGEGNRDVLGGLLGLSGRELDELTSAGVLATRPDGTA